MAIQVLDQTRKTITTAGTAEAIGSGKYRDVVLTADSTNVGNIYIGGPDVDSSNGLPLAAGEKIALSSLFSDIRSPDLLFDLSTIYADCDNNGEKVRILTINLLGPRSTGR